MELTQGSSKGASGAEFKTRGGPWKSYICPTRGWSDVIYQAYKASGKAIIGNSPPETAPDLSSNSDA